MKRSTCVLALLCAIALVGLNPGCQSVKVEGNLAKAETTHFHLFFEAVSIPKHDFQSTYTLLANAAQVDQVTNIQRSPDTGLLGFLNQIIGWETIQIFAVTKEGAPANP